MTTIPPAAAQPAPAPFRAAALARSGLLTPTAAVLALCFLQLLFWTLVPALSRSALPRNVIEGYGWAREWIVLSYKHPQLPAWCLGLSRFLYGGIGWPAYLVSQIFVCVTYIFVFLLGRDLVGGRHAAAGTLFLAGCYFFTWPTVQFDHNVAQMPFWAAIAWCLWRASGQDRPGWWLALAAAAGLGMYAKLSTGLLLLACLAWLLADRQARARFAGIGPWLALAVFVLLVCPLLYELWALDFQPLKYMSAESAGLRHNPLFFIAKEIGDNAALFVLIGVVLFAARGREQTAGPFTLERRRWIFLLLVGVAPLACVALASLRGDINAGWAAPMYNLVGLVVVGLLGSRLTARAFDYLAVSALGLVVLFALALPATEIWQSMAAQPRSTALWPEAAIASRFEALWRAKTGAPLAVVGGDPWIAGLIADPLPQARVFTELDPSEAPWITADTVEQKGLLVVWRAGSEPAQVADLETASPASIFGQETFIWSRADRAEPLRIAYLLLPPGNRAGAFLRRQN
ncbi:glycosyltransferase family 39 protein [Labrys monachus]|uniref:4-amino-4-deoxy-L-arabinose transferase-like glycosyltransferase n=1 Tax=Labrys monachus TaxID=217067 RepID=A0ABU0FBX6_9HYPH|nr:glycosyltransferase family 39 protein [Labrys monachus]MDQ0392105.1 4-amino-4-deoxy-L-arabinose transferase-like glycosyltransferase [Labrys monachus]